MQFAKPLRDRVRSGEITCTVRVWLAPKVKVGGRYKLGSGYVVVEAMQQIDFESISPTLARRSGFASVADLLRTAIHGPGRNVYLIEFHYEETNGPQRREAKGVKSTRSKQRSAGRRSG